ncbi:MAG: FAD binding domain-containing protein [Woeseiaceae bacterium]
MPSATASTLRPTQLPDIELHRPTTQGDLLRHLSDGAFVLAGGTDLVLWASQSGKPNRLVWSGGIEEFHCIEIDPTRIRVGAAVTLSRLVRSNSFRVAASAVFDGAQLIGSVQLRNQATLVGNLCTASPAGDTIPGLLVHDATVETTSASGKRREVDIGSFLIGPGKTDLGADEIVTAVKLTPLGRGEASCFRRFTQREALDLAFASVAARVAFEPDGSTVRDVRLALGAVDKTVIEAPDAAAILKGRALNDTALRECADAAAETCSPISDHRASARYRRQLVRALIIDVVAQAGQRVRDER